MKKNKTKAIFCVVTYKVTLFIHISRNGLWITLDLLFGYTAARVLKLGFLMDLCMSMVAVG